MLGTTAETRDGTGKDPSDTDDKNQIKNRFISSQIFHRTPDGRARKITVRVQFRLENLELFIRQLKNHTGNPPAEESSCTQKFYL
jgi:hypothetical protein